MATYEAKRTRSGPTGTNHHGATDDAAEHRLRLGQDVRIVFVAVGGGAVRVGHDIARERIRHLETVAINCDPKVSGFEEYDQRIYLGPDSGDERDTGGSAFVGGMLARAAEPALQRIFKGATFVVVLGSLGGGAGSGAFPHVLDLASRQAVVVSAFVLKPFQCEGERRALAERAIARLHFIASFEEKRARGCASLRTLDNESLVAGYGRTAFRDVARHWAGVIAEHIEGSFLGPVESLLGARRLSELAAAAGPEPVPLGSAPGLAPGTPPALPASPTPLPPLLPAAYAEGAEAELTFEIISEARPPTPP